MPSHSGARDLAFCLKVALDSLLVRASSGGSGKTARMRRLVWTFAARIGDKYQIHSTWSILAHFCGFVSKTRGLFFVYFNLRGQQHPRKIILILFRENRRVGGTTWLSLDRSTVLKENLRPKYLKHNEDTCSLTGKQTKRTYLHSVGWIKRLFRKQWNVGFACLLCCVIRHSFP